MGNKTNVKRVEVAKPPITTMAKGFWISAPGPVANKSGTNPNAVMPAVIKTGRNLRCEPSTTTSEISLPSARN